MAKTQPADNHLLIPYRGEAGQFQHYSYIDVLEGRIRLWHLKIGMYLIHSASGLGDINKTPFWFDALVWKYMQISWSRF